MRNAAHDISDSMHSIIGGTVAVATMAMMQARQERQAAQDLNAHLAAIAAQARAGVLRSTVAELREDLEDAREDLMMSAQVVSSLQRQVARLTAERDAALARRAV